MPDEPSRALPVAKTKGPAKQPALGSLFNRLKRSSAGRLAAASGADFLLEAVEADRADHDLLADHVARRAVHAHRLGELEVFFDRRAHFRAGEVFFDLR